MSSSYTGREPLAADEPEGEKGAGAKDTSSVLTENDSLTSLTPSIVDFQLENGRTYHVLSEGKYLLPNDQLEQDRLLIQHLLYGVTLKGRLCLCPKNEGARRVLDLGTGPGDWAIDYADRHPEAQVIGVDLSPIQPGLVSPNCSFEIDDIEKEWTWERPFDFIFARMLVGAFADWPSIISKAFERVDASLAKALEPGGYFEMEDITFPICCDDGTLKSDSPLLQWCKFLMLAFEKAGRPITCVGQYKEWLEEAGFEDVQREILYWPVNTWPRDHHYKEVGSWVLADLDSGLESLSMALLTRCLGWTKEETLNFCMTVRKALGDRQAHAYFPVHFVYGRKPVPKDKGKRAAMKS